VTPDARLARIATNEARFREINDRLERDLRSVPHTPEQLEFVCECAHRGCEALIPLTFAEYEAVRRDSRRFAVHPGHTILDAERVVLSCDRYEVVEKIGEAGVGAADAEDARASEGEGLRSTDASP
jgi:hypothetical protein